MRDIIICVGFFTTMVLGGCMIGAGVAHEMVTKEFEAEAIKRGYAEYKFVPYLDKPYEGELRFIWKDLK